MRAARAYSLHQDAPTIPAVMLAKKINMKESESAILKIFILKALHQDSNVSTYMSFNATVILAPGHRADGNSRSSCRSHTHAATQELRPAVHNEQ